MRSSFFSVVVGALVLTMAAPGAGANDDDDEPTRTETEAADNEFLVDLLKEQTLQRQLEAGDHGKQMEFDVVPACAVGGIDVCRRDARCPDGELMYNVYVVVGGVRSETPTPRCFEDTEPEQAKITSTMVRRALRRVSLPKPALSIQPPGGRTLVNFETIFSTDADSFRRTVRLLGHRVQLDITPTAYVWSYGDGTSETTSEPGVAWEEGLPMSAYLTHVYEDAHVTMRPKVAVTYGARFRVDGGPWREVSGTVTSEGAPVDLRVIEGRATLLGGY